MQTKWIPNKIKTIILLALIILAALLVLPARKIPVTKEREILVTKKTDTTNSLFKYKNILFCLPSPYHISHLLKRSDITYNPGLLNPTSRANDYIDNFHKAINFGVYGSDLGYINIYDQHQEAANYFATLKNLSQEMGLYHSLDKTTIKRIEQNIENKDSLLIIVSNTYRQIDHYLKENLRQNTGSLILAGGWIESMYLLTQQLPTKPNKELMQHIAQQKHPLDNLIKLLVTYSNESNDYYWLVEHLIDLAYCYNEIPENYTHIASETDKDKKSTLIKSKSEYLITEEHLKKITTQIAQIRENIVK